ncbi:unnamed protein product [Timema podura]|uniref:Uncharacterized protein n=1 Tax=Timema podura TaxID=61482 RepID=A0ABN7P6S2_TIMPD|nr:unnamed protein product [Timema podura]
MLCKVKQQPHLPVVVRQKYPDQVYDVVVLQLSQQLQQKLNNGSQSSRALLEVLVNMDMKASSSALFSRGSLSEDPKKYQVCGHVLCSTCVKPGMTTCPKCGAPSRSSEITTDNFSKNFLLASRKVSQLLGFTR